jgi:histidine triad (HIT) family protein
MDDCIFCNIAAGQVPVALLYEDDDVIAFNDINPVAPVHVLIIPRRHFATTLDMADEAPELYGALMKGMAAIARKLGVDESGFRLILNTNADGGQEVFHVHMHMLGGEPIGPMRDQGSF